MTDHIIKIRKVERLFCEDKCGECESFEPTMGDIGNCVHLYDALRNAGVDAEQVAVRADAEACGEFTISADALEERADQAWELEVRKRQAKVYGEHLTAEGKRLVA